MIVKAVTPSDIRTGSLYLTAGLRKLLHGVNEGRFDLVFGGMTLHSRHAGPQSMWMGYEFMRQFSPGDRLAFRTDGSAVFVELVGGSEPDPDLDE